MLPPARPEVAAMPLPDPGEPPTPRAERLVKLSSSVAPFPPSPEVLRAIADLDPEPLRAYPPRGAVAFCEAAARLHGVEPRNVLAGNGVDEVLSIIARAWLGPARRAAAPRPTYGRYETLCALQGAPCVGVDWRDGFALPAAELLALRADVIFLANPNVPTGTFVPPGDIAELAARFEGLLVIDEACVDFAEDNCLGLLADHENVVICRSLSKGYALAGLRFGYALGNAEVIAELSKVAEPCNTDAISQVAAVAALGDQEYAARIWQLVREERARLTLELQLMKFVVPPSQANFVLARHPEFADASELYEGLRKQGVLVRYWAEPGLADAIRITVGTSQENNALLAALEPMVRRQTA